MTRRARLAAAALPLEVCDLTAYAARLGTRLGTVKRWRHEGMPVIDLGDGIVRVVPAAADVWVLAHRGQSIAFHRVSRIYFAQVGSDGPVKVGFSSDVERRLRELALEVGRPLRLLASLPGDKPTELRIHAVLAPFSLGGEWFAPAPPVFEALRRAQEVSRAAA